MENKKSKKILIIISLILLILIIMFLLFMFKKSKENNKYDYNINYQENMSTYSINKLNNEIEVKEEQQVECIKAPCETIKNNYKINFTSENMQIVNNFIDSLFSKRENNSIELSKENLSSKEYAILKSIINNDETLLNTNDSLQYTIITDSKYKTLLNDGGSNYNIYYELDLNKNIVKQFMDHYIGFKGYEYQGKLIYEKNIDKELSNDINNLLIDLFTKEDINNGNYSPYTIKNNNNEKNIYNEESINNLKILLDKIDALN